MMNASGSVRSTDSRFEGFWCDFPLLALDFPTADFGDKFQSIFDLSTRPLKDLHESRLQNWFYRNVVDLLRLEKLEFGVTGSPNGISSWEGGERNSFLSQLFRVQGTVFYCVPSMFVTVMLSPVKPVPCTFS
jgi:hypothetical protein